MEAEVRAILTDAVSPHSGEALNLAQALGRSFTAIDGVELVEYGPRYVAGSPADKRAERQVAFWFLLAGALAVAFIVIFIWWPWQFVNYNEPGQLLYALYTPLIGLTLGGCILAFGIGVGHFLILALGILLARRVLSL